jgi:hypothetical protein
VSGEQRANHNVEMVRACPLVLLLGRFCPPPPGPLQGRSLKRKEKNAPGGAAQIRKLRGASG